MKLSRLFLTFREFRASWLSKDKLCPDTREIGDVMNTEMQIPRKSNAELVAIMRHGSRTYIEKCEKHFDWLQFQRAEFVKAFSNHANIL